MPAVSLNMSEHTSISIGAVAMPIASQPHAAEQTEWEADRTAANSAATEAVSHQDNDDTETAPTPTSCSSLPWMTHTNIELLEQYKAGVSFSSIAEYFERPVNDIRLRLLGMGIRVDQPKALHKAESKLWDLQRQERYDQQQQQSSGEASDVATSSSASNFAETFIACKRRRLSGTSINYNVRVMQKAQQWHAVAEKLADAQAKAKRARGPMQQSGYSGGQPVLPKLEAMPSPSKLSPKVDKKLPLSDYDYECAVCGDAGDVILCEGKVAGEFCSKVYHLACVGLTTNPKYTWLCPRHACNACDNSTIVTYFCSGPVCRDSWCYRCIGGARTNQKLVDDDVANRQMVAAGKAHRFVYCPECRLDRDEELFTRSRAEKPFRRGKLNVEEIAEELIISPEQQMWIVSNFNAIKQRLPDRQHVSNRTILHVYAAIEECKALSDAPHSSASADSRATVPKEQRERQRKSGSVSALPTPLPPNYPSIYRRSSALEATTQSASKRSDATDDAGVLDLTRNDAMACKIW